MDKVQSMGYRQAIIERLDAQTEKGIAKYGDTIDKSGHLQGVEQTLDYLAEELTDGLVYIQHAKALLQNLRKENSRMRIHLQTIADLELHPEATIRAKIALGTEGDQ